MNSKKKGEEGSSSFLGKIFKARKNDSVDIEEEVPQYRQNYKKSQSVITDSKFSGLTEKKKKNEVLRALGTTKSDRCHEKWLNQWKSQDVFGQSVHFTFKGKKTYNTSFGALISIFIKIIMAFFIGYEAYVIFARKHPAVSVKY